MRRLSAKFRWLFFFAGIMVVAQVFNWVFQGWLFQFGLIPRQLDSLPGIYIAPFLHSDLGHLINNLVGLFIFSSLLFVHSLKRYLWSSFFIITLTGVLVWCFGRNALHIGASGWIFGLWSLTIAIAWFDRRFLNILIALVVAFFYGGMLWGVLPTDPRVSFESHLFGAIAGVVCAFFQTGRNRP
ncbi:rhomboid family intramembrane serine protease [Cellvibrio mixtus]|uniref:rhomboid family intramembrane serine protease n=1 Tax=Cellvibrio mixtus TaxID=39650 RepID=UPI0005872C7B|nr:rhomboid family intramembrane serine protease [Cellvibrio mixtus]